MSRAEVTFVLAAFASLALTWIAGNAALAVVAFRRRTFGHPGAVPAAAGGVAGASLPGLLAVIFACQLLGIAPEWGNDERVPLAVGAVWVVGLWLTAAGLWRAGGRDLRRLLGWGAAAAAVAAAAGALPYARVDSDNERVQVGLAAALLQGAAAAGMTAFAGGWRAALAGACGVVGSAGLASAFLPEILERVDWLNDLPERELAALLGGLFAALAAQPIFATLAARRVWDEDETPPIDPAAEDPP